MTTPTQSLQFPLQLSTGPVTAQVHLDGEGVLRAGVAVVDTEIGCGEDWMSLLTGLFGGLIAVAPLSVLLPSYGIFDVPHGHVHAYSIAPLSPTAQIQAFPRAAVHISRGDETVEIRCSVRRPRTLDVEQVLVLTLDEFGGTHRSIID